MYQVLVLIHLISAITWLGGMLFLLMVMIPLARRDADVGFGTLRAAAEKFVPIAWAAKLVLAGLGRVSRLGVLERPAGHVLHRQ